MGASVSHSSSPSPKEVEQSWETVMKKVRVLDDKIIENWKDDIDTLLVFAGLFSAVVTSFAIESYKNLSQDPADLTVALLTKLLQQQSGAITSTQSPVVPPFHVDPSSIRINTYWFLSLILSLTSALFGLLCKQWLQKHEGDIPVHSQSEALALRQLRTDSLNKYRVPTLMATLPIMLELALLMFFAGILERLWIVSRVPFIVAAIATCASALLYIITTFLPATIILPSILRRDEQIRKTSFKVSPYRFICPYKSPQAWVVYFIFSRINSVYRFLRKKYTRIDAISRWSDYDLNILRRVDWNVGAVEFYNGQAMNLVHVYELQGLRWLARLFRDTPSILPDIKNILLSLRPSLAMVVLRFTSIVMWSDVSNNDVSEAIENSLSYRRRKIKELSRFCCEGHYPLVSYIHPASIRFHYFLEYWLKQKDDLELMNELDFQNTVVGSIRQFSDSGGPKAAGLKFFVPFPVFTKMWTHTCRRDSKGGHSCRRIRSESIALLEILKKSWLTDSKDDFNKRLAFIFALSKHVIDASDSELVRDQKGRDFLAFINDEIKGMVEDEIKGMAEDERRKSLFGEEEVGRVIRQWIQAKQKVIANFPLDRFNSIPEFDKDIVQSVPAVPNAGADLNV